MQMQMRLAMMQFVLLDGARRSVIRVFESCRLAAGIAKRNKPTFLAAKVWERAKIIVLRDQLESFS